MEARWSESESEETNCAPDLDASTKKASGGDLSRMPAEPGFEHKHALEWPTIRQYLNSVRKMSQQRRLLLYWKALVTGRPSIAAGQGTLKSHKAVAVVSQVETGSLMVKPGFTPLPQTIQGI
jgi:hypothetical protein